MKKTGLTALLLAGLLALAPAFPARGEDNLTLYGKITVGRAAETLDLQDVRVTNMDKFRGYLDQLPNLKTVEMPGSRLSLSQLEGLMADYPGIDFGVRFGFVKKSISTRQTAFSTMNTPEDPRYPEGRFTAVKYCPELRALDLGHNALKDLTFLQALPELRVLIVADNHIEDLSPLSELKNLEYLELFFNRFTDLSPLAALTNLRDLNICRNKISDVTPLLGLKNLERLWLPDNFLTEEQKAELEAALPDCQIVYEWSRSTSFGWRRHPRYTIVRRMFEQGVYEPFEPAVRP